MLSQRFTRLACGSKIRMHKQRFPIRELRIPGLKVNVSSSKEFVDALPKQWQLYAKLARFNNPTGTLLVAIPSLCGVALFAYPGTLPSLIVTSKFAVGAVLMRGAGCTINDIFDRDLDSKVLRTQSRPLVNGQISMQQASLFAAAQLSLAFLILLTFNETTFTIGALSLPLVIGYPFVKRFSHYAQLCLGITLNWGVLMASPACLGYVDASVIPLYVSCVAFTLFYDTIYSLQDKEDDMKAGVNSLAIKFGDDVKMWLTRFAATWIGGLLLTGLSSGQSIVYYIGIGYLGYSIRIILENLDVKSSIKCWKAFKESSRHLLILLGVLVFSNLFRRRSRNH